MGEEIERVSNDEIEAEEAVSLPSKEVMSLLDVNANVDLGLDLAAPVDLAVAANLNVAAPIEAAAGANLLSADAQAVSIAQQHGTIDQGISGSADATAPQHADISQDANADQAAPAPVADAADPATGGATGGAVGDVGGATGGAVGDVGGAAGGAVGDVGGAAGGAVGDVGGAAGGAVGDVGGAAGGAVGDVGGVTGGVGDVLNGGSLLDANIDIHANANVASPIDGAVAANANVAAPIDAAVSANIGSDHAVAQSLADQQVDIHQHLDGVEANATAEQDSTVDQQ
jgi:hypothetical protein